MNLFDKSCIGGNMAMKIDIRKAFDTLSWDFLKAMFVAFGFSGKFYTWISAILASARISILMSGSPVGYFSCTRGVHQRDHLSPILFNIAEDFLSRLILQKVQSSEVVPILVARGFITLSYFLYTNEILLFCRATKANVRRVLDSFHNMDKFLINRLIGRNLIYTLGS